MLFWFFLRIVSGWSMQVEGAEARGRVQMAVDTTEILFQDMISVRRLNFIPERKGIIKAEDSGWGIA